MRWLKSAPWCLAAVVLLAAGCGSAGETVTAKAAATPGAAAAPARSGKPVWLQSLRMTSASAGWALYYPGDPANSPSNAYPMLARTADGARTWTDVTPAAARPLLATSNATEVLDAVDAEHAYLAVTGSARVSASAVNSTVVFATGDGGRTWTESSPIRSAGTPALLSFADAVHGWLLMSVGAAMGQNGVRMYRTADGGRRWSLAAASPPQVSGTGTGIPVQCDKTGMAFATTMAGWLTSICAAGLRDELLVSRDGGVTWAAQPLPLPAGICDGGGCVLTGPQFTAGTGFLTVTAGDGTPSLLISRDLGQAWTPLALPAVSGRYPQIKFFGPSAGILVAAGAQGTLGNVFYTTSDGGQTWTPVPQGIHFTQLGASIEFVSPRAGFAWISGGDATGGSAPDLYRTTNSGRTWTGFVPRLDG